MSIKDIILFPFGGNTKEAITCIERINDQSKRWNIVGIIDDNQKLHGQSYAGVKILGGRDQIANYPDANFLVAQGNPDNFLKRESVLDSLNLPKARLATIIDPSAVVSSQTQVGENCLIMAGVVLTSNCKIGNNCVILPNTVISHDSEIEDFNLIGSNVTISGNVKIAENSYIGSGVKIINGVTVGSEILVGIGSTVVKSITQKGIYIGSPAKFLKSF